MLLHEGSNDPDNERPSVTDNKLLCRVVESVEYGYKIKSPQTRLSAI
jgi:hypothetical protein